MVEHSKRLHTLGCQDVTVSLPLPAVDVPGMWGGKSTKGQSAPCDHSATQNECRSVWRV